MKQKLLLLLCFFATTFSFAQTFTDNGINYNVTSATVPYTVEVIANSPVYSGVVNLLSTVTYNSNTYSVTSIGNSAFDGCSGLTSVIIPSSVTRIGDNAFTNCTGLTSVTIIGNSITTIGAQAFLNCGNLTSITLPNSVTSILTEAFSNCSSLTSITIPNSVTIIGASAFFGCTSLNTVTVNWQNLVDIPVITNDVFSGITNTTLKVPLCTSNLYEAASVWTDFNIIDNGTTNYNGINYNMTSSSTVEVGINNGFSGHANIPATITCGGQVYNVTSIGTFAFSNCTGLTSVTIPNSITSIGVGAFYGCTGLGVVTLPDSVLSIGNNSFAHCSNLTTFNFSNNLQTIGNHSFGSCYNLATINMPNSVTSMGEGAFFGCSSLTAITLSNNITNIGMQTFFQCLALTSITIPNSVTSIGVNAFAFCTSLTSVEIPTSVTSIADTAFSICTSLKSVTASWTNPPAINPNVFEAVQLDSVNLIVPVSSMATYDGELVWTDFNIFAPANIALSANSIDENVAANTLVGTLSSIDTDGGTGYTYSLVSGTGDDDNTAFTINNSDLIINNSPNFDVQNSYSVRIRTTDNGDLYYEKEFTITINNVNESPTDIALSATEINENVAANSVVGALSTTDPDSGSTFTYTLVSGTGDTNNNSFTINGSNLQISNSPDFETQNSYSIRIRTTDQGGLFFEKQFTITIIDLQEAPRGCWASVSIGGQHTLAIAQDGTLWAWGSQANGQLGNNVTSGNVLNPTQISNNPNWAFVSAGEFYSLAIKKDGTLWGWGRNTDGQLGDGTTTQRNTPVQIGTATDWVGVYAGYAHSIARKSNNTLWTWGRNTSGQLGINSTAVQQTPIQVGTDTNWQTVSVGRNHTVAIKNNGELWAWGSNLFGQLGLGNYTNQLTPVRVGSGTWKSIEAGDYYNVAIKTNNSLYSWGDNNFGQLGIGNTTEQTSPVQIGTATDWKAIAAGLYNIYAIKTTGTLWACGDGGKGQIGIGDFNQQNSLVQVGTATDWYSVFAGNEFAVAQKTTGTFYSWGDNQSGQLGNGSTLPNNTGQSIPGTMGCAGNILAFDGVDDRVRIVNNGTGVIGDNSINESYTVEMKVKLNTVASNKLVSKNTAAQGFTIETDASGKLFFDQAYGGFFSRTQTSTPLSTNIWYRIVATFDYATKTHKLYVNGTLVDTKTETGTPSFSATDTGLGYSYGTASGKFDGQFNDLRIWNIARTPVEVSSYTRISQVASDISNLLTHFKFNQGIANANNAGLTILANEVVGGPVGTLQNFALNGTTSNWSFDVTANETLNTNEFSISNNIEVYPNPSTGIYTIDLNEDAQVEVYDLLGKVVYTGKVQAGKTTLDISNYKAGLYLLNVKSEKEYITKKLLKQ